MADGKDAGKEVEQKFNEEEVRKFYRLLGHERQTEIRLIDRTNKELPRNIFVSSEDEFVKVCKQYNGLYDVYAGVNERADRGKSSADVVTINLIPIDIDSKHKPATSEELQECINVTAEITKTIIEKSDIEPSSDISGNGGHILAPVPRIAVTDANRQELNDKISQFCKDINKKFENIKVKIDNIGDLPRVIRVTGTFNKKSQSLSKFLIYHEREENQKLLDYILGLEIENKVSSTDISEFTEIEDESNKSYDDFILLMTKDEKLKKLFNGENLNFPTRSEADLSFMIKLIWYDFSKKIIWEIFSKSERTKWKEGKKQYQELLYKKGLEQVKQQIKKKYSRFIKNLGGTEESKSEIKILDDDTLAWNELKEVMTKDYFDNGFFELELNKNKTYKGKVLNKIFEEKRDLSIAQAYTYRDEQGITRRDLAFFDNLKSIKYRRTGDEFTLCFYIYLFIHNEKKIYIFSKGELETAEYVLSGVEIKISDNVAIGDKTLFPTNTTIFLLTCAEQIKPIWNNHHDFMNDMKKHELTHDKLLNYILSNKNFKNKSARQPKILERILLAELISSKNDGYPNHLLIFGPAGTKKSSIIEAIQQKIEPTTEIVEGSGSTIKALIPSFKGVSPEPGSFIKATRICFVDEFLRLLMRTPTEERGSQLTVLNPLLEHKEREFASGNGRFKGKATAKLIAGTNPVYGTKTILDFLDNFSESDSFISRLFIYYQSESDVEFARNSKNLEDNNFKIENSEFLGIYDYLNSFSSEFESSKVDEIFNQFKEILPDKLIDIYDARYSHHIKCLFDGLIKIRCLFENDEKFCAKEEDYEDLKYTWREIISNWLGSDISNKNPIYLKRFLTREEKYILDLIGSSPYLWDYQLIKKAEEEKIPNYENCIKRLLEFQLIKFVDRKYSIMENSDETTTL